MLFLNLSDQYGLYAEAASLFRFHVALRQCSRYVQPPSCRPIHNFANES